MSATEVLRRLLDARGIEYFKHEDGEPLRKLEKADKPATSWHMGGAGVCAVPIEGSDLFDLWIDHCTPEQAVKATLGSELPYDELLRCLENDWHISASWDGLRKFWCIELTEEGVKLRNSAHNTLTAEHVRDVIEVAKVELLESCKYLGDYEQRTNDVLKAFGKMEQEIAATMGGR